MIHTIAIIPTADHVSLLAECGGEVPPVIEEIAALATEEDRHVGRFNTFTTHPLAQAWALGVALERGKFATLLVLEE